MSGVTDEMVERAREAFDDERGRAAGIPNLVTCMRAALAAAAPLIAEAERGRCLAVARRWTRDGRSATAHGIILGIEELSRHPRALDGGGAMSDTQRCEPPEHLRGVDGWHWVQWPEGPPQLLRWRYVPKMEAHGWTLNTHSTTADGATNAGWRYRAPVTPPSTVAALVEALEAADQFIRNGIELGYIRMPSPSTPDPALETPDKVANALALYRGDVA